jgi:methionyl-tRNA formyltransferase
MATVQNYVVATLRPWNIELFHARSPAWPGSWHLVTDSSELTRDRLLALQPRYIFFPHWSDRVEADIVRDFECVCFHESDLPFGRGGSPLQNLIQRGYTETVVTAFRMVEELDAGPIYSKRPLSLLGVAEEIYLRGAAIVYAMIEEIVQREPVPVPQEGTPSFFRRRVPEQSLIAEELSDLSALFDHIRMLDAAEYPRAFLRYGNFRIEFTRPALRTGSLEATARITLAPGTD